jgi:hypothetical protein
MTSEYEYDVFLPVINKNVLIKTECEMNLKAYRFAVIWLDRLGERANRMICDKRLVRAAQKHAEYLNSRTPDQYQSMHIGRNNSYPNERARDEGYILPDYYKDDSNNIESCIRTSQEPLDAVNGLYNSPSHYNHITGQGWFEDHIVYGIGYCENDWVVLIAPKE